MKQLLKKIKNPDRVVVINLVASTNFSSAGEIGRDFYNNTKINQSVGNAQCIHNIIESEKTPIKVIEKGLDVKFGRECEKIIEQQVIEERFKIMCDGKVIDNTQQPNSIIIEEQKFFPIQSSCVYLKRPDSETQKQIEITPPKLGLLEIKEIELLSPMRAQRRNLNTTLSSRYQFNAARFKDYITKLMLQVFEIQKDVQSVELFIHCLGQKIILDKVDEPLRNKRLFLNLDIFNKSEAKIVKLESEESTKKIEVLKVENTQKDNEKKDERSLIPKESFVCLSSELSKLFNRKMLLRYDDHSLKNHDDILDENVNLSDSIKALSHTDYYLEYLIFAALVTVAAYASYSFTSEFVKTSNAVVINLIDFVKKAATNSLSV